MMTLYSHFSSHKHIKRILVLLLTTSLWCISLLAKEKKQWTYIVYMAAVNDLRPFAALNIKQMAQIGSNEHVNIIVHLDILLTGNKKVTRRYYVEKNRVIHVNIDDENSQQMDSGDPETLISCFAWAVEDYPAEHYALVPWNHGTGIRDIENPNIPKAHDLFVFNPITNTLDLDRSTGFIDYISHATQRGVCWDDITGHYLTNQKLEYALREIHTTILNGKKIDIIAFDACLMMMLEVANLIEPYTDFMVGSEEVELGTGYRYDYVLSPFAYGSMNPEQFAMHHVNAYKKAYNDITHDYTQSAVNLSQLAELEEAVDRIAQILIECLGKQKEKSVKKALKASRSKKITTVFDEPTYIDLHHWLTNLQASCKHFSLVSSKDEKELKDSLSTAIAYTQELIAQAVIANAVGKNLSKARGLAIYFPEKVIDPSYMKTPFAQYNAWSSFLRHYLA